MMLQDHSINVCYLYFFFCNIAMCQVLNACNNLTDGNGLQFSKITPSQLSEALLCPKEGGGAESTAWLLNKRTQSALTKI